MVWLPLGPTGHPFRCFQIPILYASVCFPGIFTHRIEVGCVRLRDTSNRSSNARDLESEMRCKREPLSGQATWWWRKKLEPFGAAAAVVPLKLEMTSHHLQVPTPRVRDLVASPPIR